MKNRREHYLFLLFAFIRTISCMILINSVNLITMSLMLPTCKAQVEKQAHNILMSILLTGIHPEHSENRNPAAPSPFRHRDYPDSRSSLLAYKEYSRG